MAILKAQPLANGVAYEKTAKEIIHFFISTNSVKTKRLKLIKIRENKRNDKCFNNRGYSLFFLMGIFLNHLWLIPNILKWQDCKIFTKLVPSQTLLRSSHWRCSVKKGAFKNLRKFTGKHLCWSHFSIKSHALRPATSLNSDSNTDVFQWNLPNF